jgi:type IV pilus assembly protein PilV
VERKAKIWACVMKESGEKKQDDGLTLIEVMIAIFILSVGVLALASLQVSAIQTNSLTSSITLATTWAADKIEKLTAMPYTDADLNDTDGDGTAGLEDSTSATADHEEFQGRFTIHWNVAVDAVGSNSKTVNVIVTWMDGARQKRVSIQDVIARI